MEDVGGRQREEQPIPRDQLGCFNKIEYAIKTRLKSDKEETSSRVLLVLFTLMSCSDFHVCHQVKPIDLDFSVF